MRRIAFTLLLALASPLAALGQKPGEELEVEREILRLENEWMGAAVRRDERVLDRLMADDFLLLGEAWDGGRELTPKQRWIRNTLTAIEAKSFSFDKVRIQARENTFVFHCLLTFEASNNGRPWGGTVRVTDIWVKDGGRWRVLARHASRTLQPKQTAGTEGLAQSAACDAAGPSALDTPLQGELKRRDLDWGKALVNRDKRLLEELLADEFTLTNPSGGFTNKRDQIRDILEGNFVITSHETGGVCVRLYGDTGVVTGRVKTVARNPVRDLSGEFRFTRVYVRRGEVWKLVAHQATRITPPAR